MGSITTSPSSVVFVHAGTAGCTGTVIGPRTVITALHCVDLSFKESANRPRSFSSNITNYEIRFTSDASVTSPTADIVTVRTLRGRAHDLAILTLDRDAPTAVMPVIGESLESHVGELVEIYGFGRTIAGTMSDFLLRSGTMRISDVVGPIVDLAAAPSAVCSGDSGGPSTMVLGGVQTIVSVHASADLDCTSSGRDYRLDNIRDSWITPNLGVTSAECGNAICETSETGGSCATDCCDASTPTSASYQNRGEYYCRTLTSDHVWLRRDIVNENAGSCGPPTCLQHVGRCGPIDWQETACSGTLGCDPCPTGTTCSTGTTPQCEGATLRPADPALCEGAVPVRLRSFPNLPASVVAETRYSGSVTYINCSQDVLLASAHSVVLRDPPLNDNWGFSRAPFPFDVPPGYQVDVPLTIVVPPVRGTYVFQLSVYTDADGFVGESSPRREITVTCATPGGCNPPIPPRVDASVVDASVISDAAAPLDSFIEPADVFVAPIVDARVAMPVDARRDPADTAVRADTSSPSPPPPPADAGMLPAVDARTPLPDVSSATVDAEPADASLAPEATALNGGCSVQAAQTTKRPQGIALGLFALGLVLAIRRSNRAHGPGRSTRSLEPRFRQRRSRGPRSLRCFHRSSCESFRPLPSRDP